RRRVEFEETLVTQPGLHVMKVERHPVFGAHQSREPRGGIESVLQKPWHCGLSILGAGGQIGLEAARPLKLSLVASSGVGGDRPGRTGCETRRAKRPLSWSEPSGAD